MQATGTGAPTTDDRDARRCAAEGAPCPNRGKHERRGRSKAPRGRTVTREAIAFLAESGRVLKPPRLMGGKAGEQDAQPRADEPRVHPLDVVPPREGRDIPVEIILAHA